MGRRDRTTLSQEEQDRLDIIRSKIRVALEEGPKTNKYFSNGMGILDYFRRIGELREMGLSIGCKRIEGGLHQFYLSKEPFPEWDVELQKTFPDGHVHRYTVRVRTETRGQAKNSAIHRKVITKVLSVRKITPEPPAPIPEPATPALTPPTLHAVGKPFASFR
jgi:hypothetical protein